MRFAPAMMAMSILSMAFENAPPGHMPSKDDIAKAARDGAHYARKLGGGSGGGLKNKAFCNAMAARCLPPLWDRTIGTVTDHYRLKNALKRKRKLMRNR